MTLFIQYSTDILFRQGSRPTTKKERPSRGPSLFFTDNENQFPSASQPQVEPFPLKGLCSKRGSNRESSQGQGAGSGPLQGGSGLGQGLTGSSQPQPFLPSLSSRPQPPLPSFPLQPQPFPFPPNRPLPLCPQNSSKSMIQQQFIGFHLLFLSYPIVCGEKGMVLTLRRRQGSFS